MVASTSRPARGSRGGSEAGGRRAAAPTRRCGRCRRPGAASRRARIAPSTRVASVVAGADPRRLACASGRRNRAELHRAVEREPAADVAPRRGARCRGSPRCRSTARPDPLRRPGRRARRMISQRCAAEPVEDRACARCRSRRARCRWRRTAPATRPRCRSGRAASRSSPRRRSISVSSGTGPPVGGAHRRSRGCRSGPSSIEVRGVAVGEVALPEQRTRRRSRRSVAQPAVAVVELAVAADDLGQRRRRRRDDRAGAEVGARVQHRERIASALAD